MENKHYLDMTMWERWTHKHEYKLLNEGQLFEYGINGEKQILKGLFRIFECEKCKKRELEKIHIVY